MSWRWIRSRPVGAYVVVGWLFVFLLLTVVVSLWYLILLFVPLYWQVYLKKDLAPGWW